LDPVCYGIPGPAGNGTIGLTETAYCPPNLSFRARQRAFAPNLEIALTWLHFRMQAAPASKSGILMAVQLKNWLERLIKTG